MSTVKVEEIQHPSNSNNAVSVASDSSVSLKHSGSAKLATTSTGVDITGTCTATTFSGSGASLTSIPAGNLTGALPAIDGSNLTGVGGGGALEFVSKTTISSSASYVDFTGLDYNHVYKLVGKKVYLSGQVSSNTEVFFMRFFLNGSSTVTSSPSNTYEFNNDTTYFTNYNGYRETIPMTIGGNAFTDCRLDIEFSTDYYSWARAWLYALSDERPRAHLTGHLNGSAYSNSSYRMSGIRLYFESGYTIEPNSEFILYKYKES